MQLIVVEVVVVVVVVVRRNLVLINCGRDNLGNSRNSCGGDDNRFFYCNQFFYALNELVGSDSDLLQFLNLNGR